jgi:hypothetical protein
MLKRMKASEHPLVFAVKEARSTAPWGAWNLTSGDCGQSCPVAGWHCGTSMYCSTTISAAAGGANARPAVPMPTTIAIRTARLRRLTFP